MLLVLKIGSSSLVGTDGTLRSDVFASLCGQVGQMVKADIQPIVVSSAATAVGMPAMGLAPGERPKHKSLTAAASAVGQVAVASEYAKHFGDVGLHVGQVLLG